VDWAPLLCAVIADVRAGLPAAGISARFHETLVEIILAVARNTGLSKVALSGGCFQNTRLLEAVVRRLEGAGFAAFWHRMVPPNDGGISLGQIAFAAASEHNRREMTRSGPFNQRTTNGHE
jgi:hydrogenase maturation protein HypF